ncbi:DUF1604 domain containing protein-like protein [Leptotrombidium deliense]|uniref:DUF1604 domain containing protein-like protein n=1 Tax=Leptotrombidium deliense TaxID=299467 RepID=A0A443S8K7_9ACAR|nr:DUF1604 domain containing protein-like protein [Leptotrombidium deliense]
MSDSDDDDIFYGTALPPLEDLQNAPKKAELDLTVRDEKGRRRFHGAFTGGFSAGYFNTVGSIEGWVPSQYVSSRQEGKWDKDLIRSKPEDYMDEEDFSAFGIAPKVVQTRDKFKSSELLGFAGFRNPEATIVDVLKDIIKPKNDSIGIKLFKAMRRGTKFKEAKVVTEPQNTVKSYGCALPPGFQRDDSDEDDDDFTIKFVIPYQPKSDFHGIGYEGLKHESSDALKSGQLTVTLSDGKRLNIKGEAFGTGALEAEDDYDEDAQVYGNDDLSNYDFSIGSKPSTSKSGKSTLNCLDRDIHFSKAKRNYGSEMFENKLPTIPRGWRPKPPFYTHKKRKSRWDQSDTSEKKEKISKESKTETDVHRTMNANTRAILLGEEVVRVVGNKSKDVKRNASNSDENKSGKSDSKEERIKETVKNENLEKLVRRTPASQYFADKFVRSEDLENTNSPLNKGLTQSQDIPKHKEEFVEVPEIKETKIGTKNRLTYQWHPHPLVAKRFNVPHPYPQFTEVVGTIRVGHTLKQ